MVTYVGKGVMEKIRELDDLKGVDVIPNPIDRPHDPGYMIFYGSINVFSLRSEECTKPLVDSRTVKIADEDSLLNLILTNHIAYKKINKIVEDIKNL